METQLIQLRPATEADTEFCYDVKKEALGPYVAEVWGWDEAFQWEFHRKDFELTRPDIVVYRDLDIGTFEITSHADHIHLGEFYLFRQFQRQGIGTILLGRVLAEATEKELPVRLEVLKNNPVRSLYQRHGFVTIGQREHHFLMERAVSENARTNSINTMDFAPAERSNLMECVDLFVSVFNNPPWNESWDTEAVTQRLDDCTRTPGFYGLIAKTGDEVVGFALGFIERWDKGKHFYLKETCIATEKQRYGVGTALLKELEEQLKNQGVAKLYLETARDTPAQAFYEKNGFNVSPKMIMMSKRLNSN